MQNPNEVKDFNAWSAPNKIKIPNAIVKKTLKTPLEDIKLIIMEINKKTCLSEIITL